MGKLTKSRVDASKPLAQEYIVWDAAVPGYGLRV